MSDILKIEALFNNKSLFKQAFSHKSYTNESKGHGEHNEKLEFLGDAVLDLAVGEFLYEKFPTESEGSLSKKRASVVNEDTLFELALSLKIDESLLLGKGELQTGGLKKPRLLASAFEALVGALFIDRGYDVVKAFIREEFSPLVDQHNAKSDYEKDYKTRLQEVVQKSTKEAPLYELIGEEGPAHDRIFKVVVKSKNKILAEGQGRSKKIAEQSAAQEALKSLSEEIQ